MPARGKLLALFVCFEYKITQTWQENKIGWLVMT
jgi:hypothetical protein